MGILCRKINFDLFEKLLGDIDEKLEHANIYIPITSMIIISILITVILNFLNTDKSV